MFVAIRMIVRHVGSFWFFLCGGAKEEKRDYGKKRRREHDRDPYIAKLEPNTRQPLCEKISCDAKSLSFRGDNLSIGKIRRGYVTIQSASDKVDEQQPSQIQQDRQIGIQRTGIDTDGGGSLVSPEDSIEARPWSVFQARAFANLRSSGQATQQFIIYDFASSRIKFRG